ncbi:MAG: protein translocase subunit SecD [Proteobacteria bacterium]|nr:protein translocase subunit SecD [Pseudomonadota bacterium]MDA0993780.1 protein translocase subunit SecD [Pseudomonadota bacterium]
MNRYPAWLNVLVLVILMLGILIAMPNIYGSSNAIQIAHRDGDLFDEARVLRVTEVLEEESITPEAAYLKEGRVVVRFESESDQKRAADLLKERFDTDSNIAITLAPKLPDWVRGLGLNPMSLGLDLRGGVYVLLEVDMDSAVASRLAAYQQDFDTRLRAERIRPLVELDGSQITVRLRSAEDVERAREIIREADSGVLILDGADGRSLRVRMNEIQIKARQDFAIEQNMTTLRNRVDQLGVAEPLVQRQGVNRIVVQLPGVQDPNELDKILTATATLELRMVDTTGDSPGSRRYPGKGVPGQLLKREVIVSGDQIIDASTGFDEGQPAVNIRLDSAGGERMLANTKANLRKPMSTVFIETRREPITLPDGTTSFRVIKTEEIINTATIQGVFKDSFRTTGLSMSEARELALLLRAGALAAPVFKVEDRTIGPTLGKENIARGFEAVQIGFLAVIVFMAIYYRGFGMIANLALFSNLIFIVALLSLLQASLTLPGIAGIVLTVGMAVDANVLIFERIREELSAGETVQKSIDAGYEKAFSSIADANVTTLIAAIVLFAFGTGPIKGFAVTLSLGIMTSMFTAIVGTRTVVNLIFGGRRLEKLSI